MDDENRVDKNPYSPTGTIGTTREFRRNVDPLLSVALMGATWSVASAFPLAALTALIFRFPIPFAGYQSGLYAMIPAIIAVAIYGVFFGGFVPIAISGAVGACIAAKLTQQRRIARVASVLITAGGLFLLAILDWIIGPW